MGNSTVGRVLFLWIEQERRAVERPFCRVEKEKNGVEKQTKGVEKKGV